jgi:membrane protease YdiL (CAAX protease family)
MSAPSANAQKSQSIPVRLPVAAYFALTFTISWSAALAVAAPHLIRHEPLPQLTGILMFPAMLLGPSVSGIMLIWIVDGRSSLRDLLSRMLLVRLPSQWYAMLLVPPVLVLFVLLLLQTFVSPVYTPNRFLIGILFGVPAGFLEEIGWTGYAFPKMRLPENSLTPAVVLGVFWSLWHLPVVNFLGTATPHGAHWFHFFVAFALAMTAMRVLICWMYNNTRSVLLAQLMHASSTASLVILSPPRVTAPQEVMWYTVYGIVLWLAVAIVVMTYGKRLVTQMNA